MGFEGLLCTLVIRIHTRRRPKQENSLEGAEQNLATCKSSLFRFKSIHF